MLARPYILLLLLLVPSALSAAQPGPSASAARAHWAFQPVKSVPPPQVRDTAWVQTPIDRFVLAKLEQAGLKPAPKADKRTLIRRASFDLIGLPPTPEEVQQFLADSSPDAFAQLVERLLESPHYGERWGRHWLDVARYADNKGYVFFEEKTFPWAWVYRDYVVRAFNTDKPFNQFVLEQLAADQLDLKGDRGTAAALGFLTVGDHLSNNTHDILDDRIDVVSRGLLGLTVSCARCHDHKFDPITMADYYALYGVFRSSTEPAVPPMVEPPPLDERYENFEVELIAREGKLRKFVQSKHDQIVEDARTRIAEYLLAVYAQRHQPSTDNFMLLADQGDLNPTVIIRWRSYLERAEAADPVWAPWLALSALEEARFAERAGPVMAKVTRDASLNPLVAAAFAQASPKSMRDVAESYAALLKRINHEWSDAIATSEGSPPSSLADPAQEQLRQVLYGPTAPADVPAQMDWGFLSLLPDRASQGEFQKLIRNLEQWLMHGPTAPARAMVLEDLPVPYSARIFRRGNPNQLGPPVPRRFVQFLDPRPLDKGSGRVQLAEAIVDPRNPLTARVWVNRVWLHHFGAGLVTTPSDFGLRSDPPSHPELLDWLAAEFVGSGWRVKALHRLIMNSAVYQQASVTADESAGAASARSAGEQKDPENRLLWRMNRSRHSFETQRDALLAVAGRLDGKEGGPPVNLATPRRTIYTFIDRMDVPPVLTTFDFPSPSTSCPQRARTTVAPQALYMMNNDFAAECAAGLMRRPDVAELSGAESKIERLYQLLFSRPPTEFERQRARDFLRDAPSEKIWQQYAQALLMANEFVFID